LLATRCKVAVSLIAIAAAIACGEGGDAPSATQAPPQAAAPSPQAAPSPPAAKPESQLAALRAHVGKYPRDVALFDTEPLHARLVALLGPQYPVFVESFGTQGPLSADGPVLYAIGNKPHAAGDEQAILLVDVERDLVNVKLMNAEDLLDFREREEAVELPPDVQTTLANWEDLAQDAE
jgi:hypothetical protein